MTLPRSGWTYVEIYAYDGERELRPTHLCGTDVTFNHPPEIVSETIRIVMQYSDLWNAFWQPDAA